MNIKNLVVFGFSLILFASLVSAITTIHVKTFPRQDFYMTPVSIGDGFNALSPPQFYSSDEFGDLVIELEDVGIDKFNLFFSLKDEAGTTTFRKKVEGPFLSGTLFNVTVAPDGATLIETPAQIFHDEPEVVITPNLTVGSGLSNLSNLTSEINVTNLTYSESETPIVPVKKAKKSVINNSVMSGGITDGSNKSFIGNNLLYILGVIVLLGIVAFLFIGRKSGRGLSPYARGIEDHYERELKKAKKEFNSAKDRLELLRGKKEILAAEKKVEADRKQLQELLEKEHKKFK